MGAHAELLRALAADVGAAADLAAIEARIGALSAQCAFGARRERSRLAWEEIRALRIDGLNVWRTTIPPETQDRWFVIVMADAGDAEKLEKAVLVCESHGALVSPVNAELEAALRARRLESAAQLALRTLGGAASEPPTAIRFGALGGARVDREGNMHLFRRPQG